MVEGGRGECACRELLWTSGSLALSSAIWAPGMSTRLRKNGGGEKHQHTRVGKRLGTGSIGEPAGSRDHPDFPKHSMVPIPQGNLLVKKAS